MAISPNQLQLLCQRVVDGAKANAGKEGSATPSTELIFENVDSLQTADPEVLERYKRQGDIAFEQNRLRPGDAGYEFDIRQDFGGDEEASWDEVRQCIVVSVHGP